MIERGLKYSAITVFIIFVLSSILWAQDSRFRGIVKDEDGNPIPKVKITLTLIAQNHSFDFKSKDNGKFYRRGIEPGEYMLNVEAEGYHSFTKKIYINVGQEYKMEISLIRVQDPGSAAKALFDKGNQLYQDGQYKEAVATFNELLQEMPDFAEGYFNLGMALNRLGETDSAIAAYQKAVELKPDFLEAYFGLGQAYFDKGEEDKAAEIFQKATSAIPDDPKAYVNLGILYFTNKKDDMALETLLKAKELDPSLPQIYYQLGLVYTRKGELEKTIASFEEFLALAPDAPEAESVQKILDDLKKRK